LNLLGLGVVVPAAWVAAVHHKSVAAAASREGREDALIIDRAMMKQAPSFTKARLSQANATQAQTNNAYTALP
jgi:hypothetical protein